ncbi:MAG: TetR/AcrR family transcriptional regulator [Actinomycetota bacterium]|nr:TetR/AcrR family transcriptional regulator [Actinomycetota bacterium]
MSTTTPAGSTGTTDGRSTRWDEHRRERRRELIEATLRAIRQHGATVGMDDIAAAAGTSKTVFYRHFTDRSGLYQAVSRRVDALILRDLSRALGETGIPLVDVSASPEALIGAAIDSYLLLVEKDPEVYRFIVAAPLLERPDGRGPGDPAAGVSGHIAEQITVVIEQALCAAGHDRAPAAVWGQGVVGMVRAAADAWLAGEPGVGGMPRAELASHLTALAWTGLSTAWPPTSSPVAAPHPKDTR